MFNHIDLSSHKAGCCLMGIRQKSSQLRFSASVSQDWLIHAHPGIRRDVWLCFNGFLGKLLRLFGYWVHTNLVLMVPGKWKKFLNLMSYYKTASLVCPSFRKKSKIILPTCLSNECASRDLGSVSSIQPNQEYLKILQSSFS